MKAKIYIPVLALTLGAVTVDAAWQRIGGIDKRPTDLASSSIKGVSVVGSNGSIGQPENLIADDVSSSTRVGAGGSDAIIQLHHQTNVDVVAFVNDGIEGRVAVAASADNKAWNSIAQSVITPADRQVSIKFASVQAKYVKLQFDLSKGGSVRSLGIFGSETDSDFSIEDAPPSSGSSVNAAGGLGGTRVIYMHPDSKGSDEEAAKYNRFEFPESPEAFRTIIYDFGKERTIAEVGSVHSARPVRFYAYTFRDQELPEKEDWRGRMSFDPSAFETQKPAVVVEDTKGLGFVKARLDKAVKARYIALRWEPDFNPPGFGVSGVSVMISSTGQASSSGAGSGSGSGTGSGNGNGSQTQGDAAQTSVTNPFSFTSGGAAGSGATSTNRPKPTPVRPAPKPRPRPRSP